MRYILTTAALFAATVIAGKRDLCADGSEKKDGNSYCQSVNAITYTGIGGSGSYNRITGMDSGTKVCTSEPHSYSGSLAPLDEEVSMHFRGPLWLKQFAVYTPGSASKARKSRRSAHARRHAHGHAHAHARHEVREAALGDEVIATIDGQVVSWANNWSGQSATAAPAASTAAPASNNVLVAAAGVVDDVLGAVTGHGSASDSSNTAGSGSSWARQGYYNAEKNISQGLVFLNHEGGAGSGTFDTSFGNSLSYAGSDGISCSDKSVTLASTTIPSSGEVVIMSDVKCSDSNPCPYSRPGTEAYHGFDGPSKVFLYEFQMPDDGQTDLSKQVNMPAIWMLNAQIPRTLQYGEGSCSCWSSGCGEFDIFEVLIPGDNRCKSTLHGNIASGDSDYFDRPVLAPKFAAVLLYNNNIHIKMFDSLDIGSSFEWSDIEDLINTTSEQNHEVSLFSLLGAAGDSTA
nr:pga52-like protein [Quercus suber]